MKSNSVSKFSKSLSNEPQKGYLAALEVKAIRIQIATKQRLMTLIKDERGDVPGWVLVVLMTTGLVTALWAIASPKLTSILRNSLDAMNGVR